MITIYQNKYKTFTSYIDTFHTKNGTIEDIILHELEYRIRITVLHRIEKNIE